MRQMDFKGVYGWWYTRFICSGLDRSLREVQSFDLADDGFGQSGRSLEEIL